MYEEERSAVAKAGVDLSRRGLVVGTAGNVSIRVGRHVMISPSGVPYEDVTVGDVGVYDLDGGAIEARLNPSSELPLHLAIYRATDHNAIVHTHAPGSTAMSTVVGEVPATHYYTVMFGGRIRVAPYARFGSDQLASGVVRALEDRTAALMQNHGAVAVGDRLEKVIELMPYLEYVCEVQLRAGTYGNPRLLSDEELADAAQGMAGYGQVGSGGRTPTDK